MPANVTTERSLETSTATPAGPRPGPPTNVTVEKFAQGYVISWLPPANKTVPVAYYSINYKVGNGKWNSSGQVSKETSYLAKNLKPGEVYHFQVVAHSILGAGTASKEIKYWVEAINQKQSKERAIAAGVVGGILFFIAAIVLSVCAVKICNKRKRRKAEKAYMMVTCPIMDARNGGHSHGGSPVPLKQHAKSGISSLIMLNLRGLFERIFGGQFSSRSADMRNIAGRSSSSTGPPQKEVLRNRLERDSSVKETYRPIPPSRTRRGMRNLQNTVDLDYSSQLSWKNRSPSGKYIITKNISREQTDAVRRLNGDQAAHVNDLTPSIGMASVRGSMRSDGSGQSALHLQNPTGSYFQRSITLPLALSKSSDRTHRDSFNQFIPTTYSPQDPRFRTSSPGPGLAGPLVIEELSSVHQSSSFEKPSSLMTSSISNTVPGLSPQNELPLLSLLHQRNQNQQQQYLRATIPIPKPFRPTFLTPLTLDMNQHAQSERQSPSSEFMRWRSRRSHSSRLGLESNAWGADHIHTGLNHRWYNPSQNWLYSTQRAAQNRPHYQNVPQRVPIPKNRVYHRLIRTRDDHTLRIPDLSDTQFKPPIPPNQRPIINHPRPLYPKARYKVGEKCSSDEIDHKNRIITGSDSSSDQNPIIFIKDRLVGTNEKNRSGVLHRGPPFRHSAPELLHQGLLTPSVESQEGTPIDPKFFTRFRLPHPQVRFTPTLPEHTPSYGGEGRGFRTQSRNSVTSISSGRGSSAHDESGKKALAVRRGIESFDEFEASGSSQNKTTSSSGIASRSYSSQLHSSTSPGQSSENSNIIPHFGRFSGRGISNVHSASFISPASLQKSTPVESPQSEPIFPSFAPPLDPIDISADENYEFDSKSQLESELIVKLRHQQQRWRRLREQQQLNTHQFSRRPEIQSFHHERGPFSDSEIYGSFYPRSGRTSGRYDTQARCAALKEEFLRFRERQKQHEQQHHQKDREPQQLHHLHHNRISSSDELESAC